jgi:hypothetical protein
MLIMGIRAVYVGGKAGTPVCSRFIFTPPIKTIEQFFVVARGRVVG